jgi:hypothetical protein
LRFGAPEEAQDTSYFAASARMRSFACSFGSMFFRDLPVPDLF